MLRYYEPIKPEAPSLIPTGREHHSNPSNEDFIKRTYTLLIKGLEELESKVVRAQDDERQTANLYFTLASLALSLGMENIGVTLHEMSQDENRHYNELDKILIAIAAKKKELGI